MKHHRTNPKRAFDDGITANPGCATNKLAQKIRPILAQAKATPLPESDGLHLTGRLEEAQPWR